MTTNEHTPTFHEAPASWNTLYLSPEGFRCQLTLRGESGKEIIEKAQAAIAHLQAQGCQPQPSHTTVKSSNGNGHAKDVRLCPIHHEEMRRWEKDGKVWYSHKLGEGWCKGK